MAETTPFKDAVNADVVRYYAENAASAARELDVAFDATGFRTRALDGLQDLELKARIKKIAASLHGAFGGEYLPGLSVLVAILRRREAASVADPSVLDMSMVFYHWPMAQYVEEYGLHELEASERAMRVITRWASCEFAVRPFLVQYPAEMLAYMHQWAVDESVHVRRNASEGIRPRLPWGMRLQAYVDDPTPVFAVLEKLRKDPQEYVRRSVSNCLNDVAKDHPDALMDMLDRWDRDPDANSLWIKKRALRTLVKDGNPRALALLGFGPPRVVVEQLATDKPAYTLGDTMEIRFAVVSTSDEVQELAIDYRVHYVKANGTRRPKVFKCVTRSLAPGERCEIVKRQHLKPISTRRYYAGAHALDVQVNGQASHLVEFALSV